MERKDEKTKKKHRKTITKKGESVNNEPSLRCTTNIDEEKMGARNQR